MEVLSGLFSGPVMVLSPRLAWSSARNTTQPLSPQNHLSLSFGDLTSAVEAERMELQAEDTATLSLWRAVDCHLSTRPTGDNLGICTRRSRV